MTHTAIAFTTHSLKGSVDSNTGFCKTGDGVPLVQHTPETGVPIGNRLVDEQEVGYRKYKIETV